jgi:exodeoxyribonuclease-3
MGPPGPAPERFRVASWNVNSLRARLGAVERFLDRTRPDVLLLQETKAATLSSGAEDSFGARGYGVVLVGAGGYNGVAIAARHPLADAVGSGELGVEALDREARLISAVVDGPVRLRVASVYVPHGREVGHAHYEYKLSFLAALAERCRTWQEGEPLLIGGDLNVAATDHDVFHPHAFAGATHVSPDERAALAQLLSTGLVDLDVRRWGERARRFTWWNYGIGYPRNLGMRIDVLAASDSLADRLDTTWIDHEERANDRPSDHAALIVDLLPGDRVAPAASRPGRIPG